jgi:mannosyl-3-phosphoglycerate phosphatase
MEYLVYTDLDGTLLDSETYSYRNSLPGLRMLKEEGIPVVFCSSKTRAEQEALREALEIDDPFIVENGGAILFEKSYFKKPHPLERMKHGYRTIELGQPYARIREILGKVRDELEPEIIGYGDSTVEEVTAATGLNRREATLAMNREYEETLLSELERPVQQKLRSALEPHGLTLARGGRFHCVKGKNNKGQAALVLTRMFRAERDNLITVGIGDSWNDGPLLSAVHIPVLVQRAPGQWQNIGIKGVKRVDQVGPRGWTRAVSKLLAGDFLSLSQKY